MSAEHPKSDAEPTIGGWGADGIATLEASGDDRRAALEAALRALLVLAGATSRESLDDDDVRWSPIRGEGDDLALLLADLVDDLLDQADYFGAGLQDVTLDGLVRRGDGGFVAWGYARGTPEKEGGLTPLSLHGPPTVSEQGSGTISIRASFAREA